MATFTVTLTRTQAGGKDHVPAGRLLVTDKDQAAGLSRALAMAGVLMARLMRERGLGQTMGLVVRVDADPPHIDYEDLIITDIDQVVEVTPESEREHPRRHGYKLDPGGPN